MRGLLLALVFIPATAAAHIHMTVPLSRTDDPTGDQKAQHCGGKARVASRVTTLMPGATVMVTWDETIQHPGYFRISFHPNGETFRIPPASNGNAIVNGTPQASNMPTEDLTGMMDAASGSYILKDRIPDGMLMTQVTLPMMECANCTLQFVQVMTDKPPYTIDAASDDIYFNCADLVLTNAPAMPDAGPGAMPDAPATTGPNGSATTGGCSTSGSGASLLVALALLFTRRRRA